WPSRSPTASTSTQAWRGSAPSSAPGWSCGTSWGWTTPTSGERSASRQVRSARGSPAARPDSWQPSGTQRSLSSSDRNEMPEHPDLDQLASAWLDGALEDEERALLAADPALAAQVEARAAPMRNLSAWLAVPSPDPARREADIALAVAELGQARSRPPTGLARRPALPRARRQRRTGAVLAWAAVIVALLFGGGVLASINLSGDDDDTGVAAPPVEFDAEDIER